jgi:hypothetical protein
MGDALFLYDGNVSLNNVTLNNNKALGGNDFSSSCFGVLGFNLNDGGIGAPSGANGGFGGNGSNGLGMSSGISGIGSNGSFGGNGSSALGGAIFGMTSVINSNDNNQGMPTILPSVTNNNLISSLDSTWKAAFDHLDFAGHRQ